VLLAHQHIWSEGRAATVEELLLCHTPEHVEFVRSVEDAVWLDGETLCTATTFEAASLAAGTAIEAALRPTLIVDTTLFVWPPITITW